MYMNFFSIATATRNMHTNAVMDLAWIPKQGADPEVVSVGGDRQVVLWKLRPDGTLNPSVALKGHLQSLKTVAANYYDPCESMSSTVKYLKPFFKMMLRLSKIVDPTRVAMCHNSHAVFRKSR